MTISSDNSTRPGHSGFRPAGTGVPLSINCMPCGGFFGNPVGGKRFRWHGVPNVWHCAGCVEKREAKAVGYTARRGSQHVLKAEAYGPDATDRDAPAILSPGVGPMGAGQPADAGPAGGEVAA